MGVKALIKPVSETTECDRRSMFEVFSKYYLKVSWSQFNDDLAAKDHVILLFNRKTKRICGFSTLVSKDMQASSGRVIGVFSGDTVLEKEHWGSPVLGLYFLGYLFMLKVKNPFTPVYWFLISKGYKTYLMMAKNFSTHYPSPLAQTPALEKSLMDAFYTEKFGHRYNAETGIIQNCGDADACRLGISVAPITDAMAAKNKLIGFFAARNPDWQEGDELACLAKMSFDMPLRYALKKLMRNKTQRTEGSANQAPKRVPQVREVAREMGSEGLVLKSDMGASYGQ